MCLSVQAMDQFSNICLPNNFQAIDAKEQRDQEIRFSIAKQLLDAGLLDFTKSEEKLAESIGGLKLPETGLVASNNNQRTFHGLEKILSRDELDLFIARMGSLPAQNFMRSSDKISNIGLTTSSGDLRLVKNNSSGSSLNIALQRLDAGDLNFTDSLKNLIDAMGLEFPELSQSAEGSATSGEQNQKRARDVSSPEGSRKRRLVPEEDMPMQDVVNNLDSGALDCTKSENDLAQQVIDEVMSTENGNQKGWYCKPCDAFFYTKNRYELHLGKHTHTKQRIQKPKLFHCDKCSVDYASRKWLQKHICRDFSTNKFN